jgi:hypothetical protein
MRRQFHLARKTRGAAFLQKVVVHPLQIEGAAGQHGKQHGEKAEERRRTNLRHSRRRQWFPPRCDARVHWTPTLAAVAASLPPEEA